SARAPLPGRAPRSSSTASSRSRSSADRRSRATAAAARTSSCANGRRYTRGMPTKDEVVEALRQVEDPELGMDIVDLGLLYDVEVNGPRVKIVYSLTSMGCPAGPLIEQDIERVVHEMPEVEAVETELTFDPPWTPDKMSDDAKFILGIG